MSDFINRQDIIEKLRKHKMFFCKNHIEYFALSENEKARVDEIDNCIVELMNFPSIEDETNKKEEKIIRCKECKYYTPMRHDLKTGICAIHCNNFGDDGFCSDAEKI